MREQPRIQNAGTSNGRFGRIARSAGQVELGSGDGVTNCPNCGRFASPGRRPVHICPYPNLIPIEPGVHDVLNVIRAAGGEPYVIGSAVREAYLGEPVGSLELAAIGTSFVNVERWLSDQQIRHRAVGTRPNLSLLVEHPVRAPELRISFAHNDDEYGMRVSSGADELDVAAGRAFTIEALMWDPGSETLVDPQGGLIDLESRVLRHAGPTFTSGAIRPLRAARLAGQYGLEIDPATAELCRTMTGQYSDLPRQFIWDEWSQIAGGAATPSAALEVLRRTGWDQLYPQITAIDGIPQDAHWHPEGSVDIHTREAVDAAVAIAHRDGLDTDDRQILVFATLAHDFGKATHTQINPDGKITAQGHAEAGVEPTEAFLGSIGCPAKYIEPVARLVEQHMCHTVAKAPSKRAVRNLARRLGTSTSVEMWAKVVEADNRGRGTASKEGPAGDWVRLAREMNIGDEPEPPILTGRDLIARGMKPGPGFRDVLAAAAAAQDNGAFTDRESAQEWLDRSLASTTTLD